MAERVKYLIFSINVHHPDESVIQKKAFLLCELGKIEHVAAYIALAHHVRH